MAARSLPSATAVVAAFLTLTFALAACSLPRSPRRVAHRRNSPEGRRAAAAFHKTFESTVPSIDAALPLATMVDTVFRKGEDVVTSRAWFSGRQPVCIKLWLTQSGDTVSTDFFYYQQGRVTAWTSTRIPREGEFGWPRVLTLHMLIAPDGTTLWLEGGTLGHKFENYLPPKDELMTEGNRMQDTLREILTRRVARLEGW